MLIPVHSGCPEAPAAISACGWRLIARDAERGSSRGHSVCRPRCFLGGTAGTFVRGFGAARVDGRTVLAALVEQVLAGDELASSS